MIPVVLSVGALDPLGADGVLADIRTLAALGAHGAAAATLVGAPATPLAAEVVAGQIAAARAATTLSAVKTGALGSAALARAVAGALAGLDAPVVADPSFAGPGDAAAPDAELVEAWRTTILPLASVITPNLAEAALLTGTNRATTLGEMRAQGEALVAMGCPTVIVTGGHGESASSIDILVTSYRPPLEMRAERLERGAMRGLSATLAAAVAAHLAHGMDPFGSVHAARLFVSTAIGAAVEHGQGGPVLAHQLSRMWRKPTPPVREE